METSPIPLGPRSHRPEPPARTPEPWTSTTAVKLDICELMRRQSGLPQGRSSVAVGADHLVTGPGREGLIDAHAGRADREDGRTDIESDVDRLEARSLESPALDRVLDELDRSVSEAEVRPTRVVARCGDRELVP